MPGNQETFQKNMNMGHTAAWDQNWQQAAEYYRQALSEFPGHPMALADLGLALYELQEFDEALKCYQQLARVSPNDPVSLEKIARIYERTGRLNEAVQASMQAAELHLKAHDAEKSIDNWIRVNSLQPENLTARTRLAMIYDKMGRKGEAIVEYLASASILQRSGELAKAMQLVEYTLRLIPGYPDSQQALSLLRNNQPLPRPTRPRGGTGPVRMAEVREFEPPKEPEATLDPISEARQKALLELAALLFDQAEETNVANQSARRNINDLTRGTASLNPEVVDRNRRTFHLGQAIDLQTHGDEAQALVELSKAFEHNLSHPAAFFIAGALAQKKDDAAALRYLQGSVQHPGYALASYLLIGQIQERTGNWPAAASTYLHALRLADCTTVPADLADELSQLYEPVIEAQSSVTDTEQLKAVCATISAQLLRPDWHNHLTLARQQLPQQPEGSLPLPLSEMLLETRSSQVVELLAHVRQLALEGKLRAAMEEAFIALQFAPTYLPLHMQIGELLVKEEHISEAVTKFMLVSDLYSIRGEAAQAVRLLKRVINIAPMDLTVRGRLIDMLMMQTRTEEALQEYLHLGEIYYQLAELDKARQTYATALRVSQQTHSTRDWSIRLLNKMADIDLQRLDLRNAIRVYEQLRTLEPEDPSARSHLVDLYFRTGQEQAAVAELDSFTSTLETTGKRGKAVTFLRQLVEEDPTRLEIRKRLADVLLRDGQVAATVEVLDGLADALMASNNRAAAISVVQSIIALAPPNIADYQNVLARLRAGI